MQTSVVVALCLLASTSAFVPRSVKLARSTARSVASEPEQALAEKSIAIPFLSRPSFLKGDLAGDVGFDPLGFADNEANLQFYAEAEVKHARLAMLCAAGWPISELVHPTLASALGAEPLLAAGGRVPSVLNGGIVTSPSGLLGLAAIVGVGAAVELATDANGRSGWGVGDGIQTPGDFGFDLTGTYAKGSAAQKKDMRTKEIKNGRVAMIAVLAYVGGEAVTGKPVTELTPAFFRPIWAVVGAAAEPVAAAAAPVMAAAAAPVVAAAAPVAAASTAATEYIAAVYSDMVGTVPTTAATEYAAAVYSDMQSLVPDVVQAAASIP